MRITVAAMRPMNIRPPITLPAIIPGILGALCGEGSLEGMGVGVWKDEDDAVDVKPVVVVVVATLVDGICARTIFHQCDEDYEVIFPDRLTCPSRFISIHTRNQASTGSNGRAVDQSERTPVSICLVKQGAVACR